MNCLTEVGQVFLMEAMVAALPDTIHWRGARSVSPRFDSRACQ